MTKWTAEQQLAIDKEGTNIIVSAGAGSGKTAVLTERVIRKLRNGVNINHLLVLTFTKAAAAEMKDRIRKSIKKEGMNEQLDYLDSSYITTFDSFAQSIVKKYHYILNISKNIKLVDESVLSIKKQEIINDIFESRYGISTFDNMINNYCIKEDKSLQNNILSISSKLDLKSNKEEYLDDYINNYYSEKNINSLLKEYEQYIFSQVDSINDILNSIKIYADGTYYSKVYDILQPLLESKTYDEVRNNRIISLPVLRNASDELKQYKEQLSSTIKLLQELCAYSYDELKINLLLTKENIEEIITIIKELDKKLLSFKQENDAYDFTDIAKMAIAIVKNNKEVQNELKTFFNEIMVDEYQDTSDLQEEFINLISNNNVYMVGDIKQSIYRFRHANPDIFRSKYNNYSNNIGGYKIDLLKNFRSRDEVLNNINLIFDSVMDEEIGNADYQTSHRMVFGNNNYTDNKSDQNYDLDILNYHKVDEFTKYKDEEIEAFIIANDIKNKYNNLYQVLDKETNKLRNFDYGDACIIMDRGSAFDTYKKIFEYLSIPLVVWQDEHLNSSDDIAVIKNLISLIIKIGKNETDQEFRYYFTSVARSYLIELDDNTIFEYTYNKNFKDSDLYIEAQEISKQLNSINNEQLLDLIINKFNIYENTIKIGNIQKNIVRLDNFKNLLANLSTLGYTPYDLINYFKESTDIDQKYSLNTKVPGNVNLMNIHKSKGLEFSICYFSGFARKFNESDIKESYIYDDKYGIIVPYYKDGLGNTIQKDLFKNKYTLDDISERIRLFYVGVTRAKEKMIIVASLDENTKEVKNIVDRDIRIKYKSFLDIMNSVKSKLIKYIVNIDLNKINITKDYDLIKVTNFKQNIDFNNTKIDELSINIDKELLEESHFSKITHRLHSKEEIDNMELGTYMHYLFETTDFKNVNNSQIKEFINQIDTNCNIYKEYEFMYEEDNNIKHGIIDLMLEYNDHIDIIDYKLKHIVDDNYKSQISGYKKYIELKTNKPVNTYLYSIIDKTLKEIK